MVLGIIIGLIVGYIIGYILSAKIQLKKYNKHILKLKDKQRV